MNSDNYEFAKSSSPQSVENYSPYVDKQRNYSNDTNNGVYSNNSGLTLVSWDLTSIYNSAGFSDASDLYLAIPILMVAALSGNAANDPILAPDTAAAYGLLSMKSNYQHLIHSLEIKCNGQVVEQMQPFVSVIKNFQLLSTMSATDLKNLSVSLGMSEVIDNEKSVQWTTTPAELGTAQPGVGLCNNKAFGILPSGPDQLIQAEKQNEGTINGAIQKRLSRFVDVSKANGASYNGIYGENTDDDSTMAIMEFDNLKKEYRPNFKIHPDGRMVWQDVALIPLKYISDFIDKLGLVKKLDLTLQIYCNCGSLAVPVIGADTANVAYDKFKFSTFSNICPFTVNYLEGTNAQGGLPSGTEQITAGLFIAKSPTTSIGAVGIDLGNFSHPMPSCRCYYSQVKLDPGRSQTYISQNRDKTIVYEKFLYNQYNAIESGGTYSQLIQSGIKNPISVLIIPFISNTCPDKLAGGNKLGFTQYGSPFDTSPSTYSPISLTDLQVTLGGINVLSTTLTYTYENFLNQVINAESLTSSDVGVAVGLINQSWFEMNRVYFVDLTRGNPADKDMPRNLNVSFFNNTKIPIDVMIFTTYLDRVSIDIQTGLLRQL